MEASRVTCPMTTANQVHVNMAEPAWMDLRYALEEKHIRFQIIALENHTIRSYTILFKELNISMEESPL